MQFDLFALPVQKLVADRATELIGDNWRDFARDERDCFVVQAGKWRISVARSTDVAVFDGNYVNDTPSGGAACVNFFPSGVIREVAFYRNGKPSDPPSGEPAETRYYESGAIFCTRHFSDGHPVDLALDIPFETTYCEQGTILFGCSAVNGRLSSEQILANIKAGRANRIKSAVSMAEPSVSVVGMIAGSRVAPLLSQSER